MKTTLIALAAVGVLASSAAGAATTVATTRHDGAFVPVQYRAEERAATINDREARINARIQRGLRDGRITDREARRLYRELHDIQAKERAFHNNNGRIGPREADELNRDLDRLTEHVRRQLHDEDRRY
ncbi:MAG TPA: hypothetical protein VFC24_09565 [Casimicrobiaceae bacterium]|nr:hypothetical protein [Casimicrobiaceae bacterium]